MIVRCLGALLIEILPFALLVIGIFWDYFGTSLSYFFCAKNLAYIMEKEYFCIGTKIRKIMGRKKAVVVKEPIRLRLKTLRDGSKSIYLMEYIPDADASHHYRYEHLKLFLVPEVDAEAKLQNANTMRAANIIKAQRLVDYANGKAGIKKAESLPKKLLLVDWMKAYRDKKLKIGQSKSNAATINNTLMHLIKYKGGKITMAQVDKAYCEGFVLYLAKAYTIGTNGKRKWGQHKPKPLAKSTAMLYFNTFVTALNEAVREDILDMNPTAKLRKEEKKPIRSGGNQRGFLEIDEVKALIKTDCQDENIKRAFLFSCFCGLRVSDIETLRWKDVKPCANGWVVEKLQVKTRLQITVPLSVNAMEWLPRLDGKARKDDLVFALPSYFKINRCVKRWAKDAGIEKNVTFHIARHTFATTLLTLGADIYTTSKLLGHQNLRTTQIYAEVVDKNKVKAVNLLNDVFQGI